MPIRSDGNGGEGGSPESSDPIFERLLDPGGAIRLVRSDELERNEILQRYGTVGPAERDLAEQLANGRPLADPERFPGAYRWAMHAIEVLDRNGARQPTLPRLGPLYPVAAAVVRVVARWIVRSHQSRLVRDIRQLLERREATAEPRSPEHAMLRRARFHTRLVEPGYAAGALGLPAFVVGGAAVSGIGSGLQTIGAAALDSTAIGVLVGLSAAFVLLGLAWCVVRAAGVARRRIRLATDDAMDELWLTIGNCGRPPRDRSFTLAVGGIALAILASLTVPLVVYAIFDW